MAEFFQPRKRKNRSAIDLSSESQSSNKTKCLEEKHYPKCVSTRNFTTENIQQLLNRE